MRKKNSNLFFFFLLIILLIFVFLVLLYFENRPVDNGQTNESQNSLILGQVGDFPDTLLYFCPEDACKEEIVSLILDSNKTIDCAIYDITSREVADALISENQEGTKIRIVTDKGRSQTKSTLVSDLKVSGINVLISPTENSYMHNKFCVFDDNISMIASANFTENSFSKSYNNILVFKSSRLSKVLKEKIDSFYLGNFSKSSNILGKTFDENFSIFFCPNNNCKFQIISNIASAKQSIACMMYSFTLDDFGDEMVKAKERGVDVKIILETQQKSQYSEFEKFKAMGVSAIEDNDPYLMHNKYCVFDNTVVTTGSMNFSNNGTNNNDETLVIIKHQKLAEDYLENFQRHWSAWNNQVN
ncbi:MAG TPA: phospholipase D-like domain-containing protein [Candidatus Diapherotrites archaeon]|nr:phospholipase D-like domain-containing protein [Candidatus Diapherotrites archaeon]